MHVRKRVLAAVAASAMCAAASIGGTATAQTSGGANGTVAYTTPVRSITVSAANPLPLNNCWASAADWNAATDGAAAPGSSLLSTGSNGYCTSGLNQSSVTITNGSAAGHVNVQGTNASAASGTGSWSLVATAPAVDQFGLETLGLIPNETGFAHASQVTASQVTTSPTCDSAINGPGISPTGTQSADYCAVTSNQIAHEDLGLLGPTSSTGSATAYNFTLTWTAVP
jgi:hypothetical protein